MTSRRVRMFAGQRLLGVRPDLTQHRYALSERLCRHFDYRVAYGPFVGLQFDSQSSWSASDRAGMILGCYEANVLRELARLCNGARPMVDIGAADGYYAVGAVYAGLTPRAFCFEMTDAGREVIRANAERNDVADRVEVTGLAGVDFLDHIPSEYWSEDRSAVFLMDIEGGEFDLLTNEVLRRMRHSYAVIELHEAPDLVPSKIDALVARAGEIFDLSVVKTGPRDPAEIPELELMSDDDRWLLMSESRPYAMSWLILEPR